MLHYVAVGCITEIVLKLLTGMTDTSTSSDLRADTKMRRHARRVALRHQEERVLYQHHRWALTHADHLVTYASPGIKLTLLPMLALLLGVVQLGRIICEYCVGGSMSNDTVHDLSISKKPFSDIKWVLVCVGRGVLHSFHSLSSSPILRIVVLLNGYLCHRVYLMDLFHIRVIQVCSFE
jgi:hypothetical protein